jgi:sugar lactone lactonase YvrE
MQGKRFVIYLVLLAVCGAASCKRARGPLVSVGTLAGHTEAVRLRDPFGVAVDKNGAIYVSDGETGQIWQFDTKGAGRVVASGLNTPSGLAVDAQGALVVAETGAHVVKRINPQDGAATIIAGQENQSGFADGKPARFNGPIGVAVGPDGTIYVADTYNDRIRAIDAGGVRTIAGGDAPGYADGDATTARFHTPCGIAVRTDGQLIVADAGNHALRLVAPNGTTARIAGGNEAGSDDGALDAAKFDEPVGVALDADGAIYVADQGNSALRVVTPRGKEAGATQTGAAQIGAVQGVISTDYAEVKTLTGKQWRGLADGPLSEARISNPSGLALTPAGALIVADTGNRLVRVVNRQGASAGVTLTREQARALRPKAEDFRQLAPPRWPYEPADRPREIAATFGELRGEVNKPDEGVWFHNGLDIPGGAGETARVVREEKALLPLSVQLFETKREYIRFPTMGYIHLRVGRDQTGKPFDDPRFLWQRDDQGKLTGVRVRRGTPFRAGDAIGTLNNQFHIHLIAGPTGGEMNALAALELPGVSDKKPPFIEGVDFYDKDWNSFVVPPSGGKGKPPEGGTTNIKGAVRIVVRAYDQMDGNAARRRLGVYRAGYQVLKADGAPAEGFSEPRLNISFETLPDDVRAGVLAYAPGSQCGYTPQTILGYVVTNTVRDRDAREDFWQPTAGDYTVRVIVEDFFGNRATKDVVVRVGG